MYRLFMTTGYDLSERQLRVYLDKFGKLSDLYLPKRADGRSKGFVFATFTTKKALSSAMRQPQHVVDGVVVEVKIAAPRPPRPVNDIQPSVPARTHMQHPFDVSFTNARGRKRLDCCYVTFVNHGCAQRAWSESERNIDGWAFESIGIAGDCEDDLTEVNAGTGPPPPVEACVPAIFQEPCQPDPARILQERSSSTCKLHTAATCQAIIGWVLAPLALAAALLFGAGLLAFLPSPAVKGKRLEALKKIAHSFEMICYKKTHHGRLPSKVRRLHFKATVEGCGFITMSSTVQADYEHMVLGMVRHDFDLNLDLNLGPDTTGMDE
ncbi:hypothetical protein WJX79_002675 [Trebouxia sp. C0005]